MTKEALQGGPSSVVRAEAAAWVARLHGSGRSRSLEAGLRLWLKADAAHARAFEIATEAWELGAGARGAAVTRMAAQGVEPAVPRQWGYGHAMAAVALFAVLGMTLFAGVWRDRFIVTAVGEQRVLTLADGSRIMLNTATRLAVRDEEAGRYVDLDQGEALFDVAHDPSRPFVVSAGGRQIVALGTSFVVRSQERQLTVTLMEGRVAVKPASGGAAGQSEMLLSPGQRVTFEERDAPRVDKPVPEEVAAWRRGEVVLDRVRLRDAADEMNRYSRIKLQIVDPATGDMPVSGVFRAGDTQRFAKAVGEIYHLDVERRGEQILISGAP